MIVDRIEKDLKRLSQVFPTLIEESIQKNKNKSRLVEIVIDLGRRPEARFLSGSEYLSEKLVSWQDLEYASKRLGKFSLDNRAGIEGTLHRISCLRNRQGMVIGLTCRIGRCVLGSIGMIRDLLDVEASLLILGKPGLGKTTLIREMSRVLSDEVQKRVVVVDTANEIGGNSDTPHLGIGGARRLQAFSFKNQHEVMIEAIENHMPEVIVVDEIGSEFEALAARTIAERGVKLIGTAHGNSLENLIKNPSLSDLIGGIHSVTLSDEEARKRGSQKTILERKSLVAFPFALELNEVNRWTIHENVEESVDTFLKKQGSLSRLQSRCFENKRLLRIGSKESTKGLHAFLYPCFLPKRLRLPKEEKRNLFDAAWLRRKVKVKKDEGQKKGSQRRKANTRSKREKPRKLSMYTSFFPFQARSAPPSLRRTKSFEKADLILVSKVFLQKNQRLQDFALQEKIPIYLVSEKNKFESFQRVIDHLQKAYRL